jgi:hypothetical protein
MSLACVLPGVVDELPVVPAVPSSVEVRLLLVLIPLAVVAGAGGALEVARATVMPAVGAANAESADVSSETAEAPAAGTEARALVTVILVVGAANADS